MSYPTIAEVHPVMKSEQVNTALPFVSVIMPVRNEGNYIKESLRAVLEQDYPDDKMEILIVDGISNDSTRALIGLIAANHPAQSIQLLENARHIVPVSMNVATKIARGSVIVRVDGHCVIAPDYISRCVAHLEADPTLAGVGGSIETIGTTPLSEAIALAMSSAFGVGGSAFRTVREKTLFADSVPFPAYTRTAIEAAGPYDEELVRNQDDEYNYRLRHLGYRLLLARDVRSRYYSRSSYRSLWRQYYQYGYWKVRVLQKHPRQMSLRQFIPPLFVAAILTLGIASLFNQTARMALPGLIGTYVLANLWASVTVARRRDRSHLFRLPLIFAILHISYGGGFLAGLLKFSSQWRVNER